MLKLCACDLLLLGSVEICGPSSRSLVFSKESFHLLLASACAPASFTSFSLYTGPQLQRPCRLYMAYSDLQKVAMSWKNEKEKGKVCARQKAACIKKGFPNEQACRKGLTRRALEPEQDAASLGDSPKQS
eukprot:1151075-Pelagomonas_calceolata.AAC.7